jgi:hypothetical protein
VIEDAVAAEHRIDVSFDELLEEQEVALAGALGEGDERGKGAGNRDDAENSWAVARLEFALVAQQESEAESLVENAGKWVRGVERYGGEERVDLLLEELDGELAIGFAELLPFQHGDAGALEFGYKTVVPAGALIVGEVMEAVAEAVHALILREASGVDVLGKAEAFFELLEDTGDTDLDELVEVAGGDGEELYSLEERVGGVVSFLEDAAIELEPALVAIDETTAGGCDGSLCGAPGCRLGGSRRGLDWRGLFPDSHASYETKSGLRRENVNFRHNPDCELVTDCELVRWLVRRADASSSRGSWRQPR